MDCSSPSSKCIEHMFDHPVGQSFPLGPLDQGLSVTSSTVTATLDTMTVTPELDTSVKWRIGSAWRELRRGASATKIKDLFYGVGDHSIDMALADALSVICQQGPLRMGELAEGLHITPASTTRAVACLVDRGYIERVKCTQDQRSVVVSATPAGRQFYDQMARRLSEGMERVLSEFSPGEQEQLANLLDRYVGAVERFVSTTSPNDLTPLR